MRIQVRRFNWRFELRLQKQVRVKGVTSDLGGGNHWLMWDFDNLSLDAVKMCLRMAQDGYGLPNIYIVKTGPERWHAYCFSMRRWIEAVHIIGDTTGIDIDFWRLGVLRGYFTLRITPKRESMPLRHAAVLESKGIEDVSPDVIVQFVGYDTHV